MKRIISLLLTAVMVLALVPFSAFNVAAETILFDGQGLGYTVSDDISYYTVYSCPHSITSSVIIPNVINHVYSLPVASIGNGAFSGCSLTSILIPESVTNIDFFAFGNCSLLTSIVIPDSVTSMDSVVFDNCSSLTDIYCEAESQPEGWATDWLGRNDATVHWGYDAPSNPEIFVGESIEVEAPCYVEFTPTESGTYTFYSIGDADTRSELYEANNLGYPLSSDDDSGEGVNFSLTYELEAGKTYLYYCGYYGSDTGTYTICIECIESDGSYIDEQGIKYTLSSDGTYYMITECNSSLSSVVIATEHNDLPVKTIENYAFQQCRNLTSISIPNSITYISYGAFLNCTGLTDIEISGSVTRIDNHAFANCTSLTSIEIPSSVTKVGSEIFYGCESLTDIYCDATSQPDGWSWSWVDGCDATVHWIGQPIDDDTSDEEIIGGGEVSGGDVSDDGNYDDPTIPSDNPIFESGNGSEEYPYIIMNAQQLSDFANSVNNGTTYAGKYIKLGADITVYGSHTPIGKGTRMGSVYVQYNYFEGDFDGDYHTVSGISFYNTDRFYGFFGAVNNATIRNLILEDVSMSSDTFVGGVAGYIKRSTIENCYVSGSISGRASVGGIVGSADGVSYIKNCYTTASITGNTFVGGIAGETEGSVYIDCCANRGNIDASDDYIGGIIGDLYNGGTISNCYNTGTINTDGGYAGGLVGYINGKGSVTNCYNIGSITANYNMRGALVGHGSASAPISRCYYLEGSAGKAIYYANNCFSDAKELTTSEMCNANSFAGFDFVSVWTMEGDKNYRYPELISLLTFTVSPDSDDPDDPENPGNSGNDNGSESDDWMLGDVNMNGKIDMTDYILLKRAYFGTYKFNDEQNDAGDINRNKKIDMTDYILLKRVYFGTYKIKED